MTDRVERLTELLMILLEPARPLSFDDLVTAGLYPDGDESSRRGFERDKAALRELGVPLQVIPNEVPSDPTRYRIDPDEYFLPDLDLTESERLALHLAASAVRLDASWDTDVLVQLGERSTVVPPLVADVPSADALADLYAAMRARAPARFTYRDRTRDVSLFGMLYREGRWYVVGDDDGTVKSFRVDRITGDVTAGEPGRYEVPERFDPSAAMPRDPLLIGEEELVARVAVDAAMASRVERLRGSDVVVRGDDGSIEVEVTVRNRDAFRSWVLGMRTHAEVLSPPELRDELVAWLRAMAA